MGRRIDASLGSESRMRSGSPVKLISRPTTRRSSLSKSCGAKSAPAARMSIASVVLLWALCCISTTSCSGSSRADLDSDLIETESGWQFVDDDNVDVFDNTTAPAPAATGNQVALTNGDFELTNITGNASFTAVDNTTTAIINWVVGGAGVQILNNNTYNMAPTAPKSVFAIHLNNPASTGNGTQGAIMTTLAINPPTGKAYTAQFDVARNPDGPINLLPAIKISSVSGATVNAWEFLHFAYNSTDTEKMITWRRLSFIYTGTGASTQLKFESMSEKYGPIIDNVVILNGKHALSAATPPPTGLRLHTLFFPLFTVVALAAAGNYNPISVSAAF